MSPPCRTAAASGRSQVERAAASMPNGHTGRNRNRAPAVRTDAAMDPHFGLTRRPFRLTPDPAAYATTPPHEAAAAVLARAFRNGDGVALVDGDPGTGKTLVGVRFLDSLPADTPRVMLAAPRQAKPAELFQALLTNLRELVTTQLSHVEIQVRPPTAPQPNLDGLEEIHIDPLTGENEVDEDLMEPARPRTAAMLAAAAGVGGAAVAEADPRLKPIDPKLLVGVSRNAPCPCGSGRKFKHCHGAF